MSKSASRTGHGTQTNIPGTTWWKEMFLVVFWRKPVLYIDDSVMNYSYDYHFDTHRDTQL